MKVSEQWLREWVNPPVTANDIAAQLTQAGLEVDDVAAATPPFDRVVVGQVLQVAPHPDAAKLHVAHVEVGDGEPLTIVCGAPNVRVGMKAPTALVGARLPTGEVLAATPLRGVMSHGMLCSANELGLNNESEGLWELPDDSPVGQDVRQWLHLDDTVLDIDLTPNRGDCLSVRGIAREVGVLNRCDVKALSDEAVNPTCDATLPITIHAPADCPRYAGRVIRNLNPASKTPLWMQERLRRCGLRSLGPVIDVTNYVLLELGQPLHAFDLHTVTGGIAVRRAQVGETLTLLTEAVVELDEQILVIADEKGPLALAGIMGGQSSAVRATTTDVFLESAFFAPTTIAGRARRYGLTTEAGYRFERGVDPQLPVRALERATHLLLDITGGQVGPLRDVVFTAHLPSSPTISLREKRIIHLLGVLLPTEDIERMLGALGMTLHRTQFGWQVTPPSSRFDIQQEVDLIEEIARLYGYDRLPVRTPAMALSLAPQPERQGSLHCVRDTLIQRGYLEAITYSFVDPAFQAALDPTPSALSLANPISAELAVMRTTLWPGLVKAAAYNQKRQQDRVRLFECGLSFRGDGTEVVQTPQIAGVVSGMAFPEQWGVSTRLVDFFDVKGDVEALLALSAHGKHCQFVAAPHPGLQPGQCAAMTIADRTVGWIGAIHPQVAQRLDLEGKVFVFQIELAYLLQARWPDYHDLTKFPASRRDLAIVVDETITAAAVQSCIQQSGGPLLREVFPFDVYRGEGIPIHRKSIAFGLIFQDFSSNLTDLMIDEVILQITASLQQQLNATLRV